MLIDEDYISNDVITLGACFQVFFNVCLHSPSFRFPLIGGNLTAQSTWSHRAIVGGIQVQRRTPLLLLIPSGCQSAPESLPAGYLFEGLNNNKDTTMQ